LADLAQLNSEPSSHRFGNALSEVDLTRPSFVLKGLGYGSERYCR
jgi:hypothetical protein